MNTSPAHGRARHDLYREHHEHGHITGEQHGVTGKDTAFVARHGTHSEMASVRIRLWQSAHNEKCERSALLAVCT